MSWPKVCKMEQKDILYSRGTLQSSNMYLLKTTYKNPTFPVPQFWELFGPAALHYKRRRSRRCASDNFLNTLGIRLKRKWWRNHKQKVLPYHSIFGLKIKRFTKISHNVKLLKLKVLRQTVSMQSCRQLYQLHAINHSKQINYSQMLGLKNAC